MLSCQYVDSGCDPGGLMRMMMMTVGVYVCVGCFVAVMRVSSLLTEVGGLSFVMKTPACNLL